MNFKQHIQQIFAIQSDSDWERLALETFHFQYERVAVYRRYCQVLGKTKPQSIAEIPFLPIEFFKSNAIRSGLRKVEIEFKSSGTQGVRSRHLIENIQLYEQSFELSYRQFIGEPEEQVILALLPNYVEQQHSSLVYMVDRLIRKSNSNLSGFYLNDGEMIHQMYVDALLQGKQPVLFGVTYALLDLAERKIKMPELCVIETGGMKGRRKEISKEEIHRILKMNLGIKTIHSEYGMCELLSQGYSMNLDFRVPSWMKILIRDKNDPFNRVSDGKIGGINVIDLANLYSCSFIQTQDLGRKQKDTFRIEGRVDQSEIRGCNLMVDELE